MQKPEQDSESADAAEGDDDSEASPEDASASNEQSGDQAEPAEKADAERGNSEDAPQAEKQMESPSSDSDGGEATASAADDGSSKQAEGEGGSTGGDAPDAKRRPSLPDPAEVALDELPVQPRNDRLTQLERQYLALSRRSLEEQPVGRLRMEYEKVLSEADLSRADRKLAEARVRTLETRQELKASLEDISTTQREMTEAEKRRRAEDAKKPPDYIAVGRLTTSTLYTGDDQPRLYRLVNPLTQRTAAYVRPGGPDGPDVRGMLGEYVGIEGETEYNSALKLHVIEPERIDELSASERPPRRGSAEAAGR